MLYYVKFGYIRFVFSDNGAMYGAPAPMVMKDSRHSGEYWSLQLRWTNAPVFARPFTSSPFGHGIDGAVKPFTKNRGDRACLLMAPGDADLDPEVWWNSIFMEWVIEALPEFCVPVTFVPANLSSSWRNTLATVYGAGVSVSGGYFGKM